MKHMFALLLFLFCAAVCAEGAAAMVEKYFGTAWAITYVVGLPALCVTVFYWATRHDC